MVEHGLSSQVAWFLTWLGQAPRKCVTLGQLLVPPVPQCSPLSYDTPSPPHHPAFSFTLLYIPSYLYGHLVCVNLSVCNPSHTYTPKHTQPDSLPCSGRSASAGTWSSLPDACSGARHIGQPAEDAGGTNARTTHWSTDIDAGAPED